jgi:hypothetical protein
MAFQSMSGSLAPMPLALSFVKVQFPYIAISLKTRWKSAIFRYETLFLSLPLQQSVRFFQHPLPSGDMVAFASSLLNLFEPP